MTFPIWRPQKYSIRVQSTSTSPKQCSDFIPALNIKRQQVAGSIKVCLISLCCPSNNGHIWPWISPPTTHKIWWWYVGTSWKCNWFVDFVVPSSRPWPPEIALSFPQRHRSLRHIGCHLSTTESHPPWKIKRLQWLHSTNSKHQSSSFPIKRYPC